MHALQTLWWVCFVPNFCYIIPRAKTEPVTNNNINIDSDPTAYSTEPHNSSKNNNSNA